MYFVNSHLTVKFNFIFEKSQKIKMRCNVIRYVIFYPEKYLVFTLKAFPAFHVLFYKIEYNCNVEFLYQQIRT